MVLDGVALTLAKEFIHRGEWLIQNNAVCCVELAAQNPGSLMATAPYDLFRLYCLIVDVKLTLKLQVGATKTQQNKGRKPCGHKCSVNSAYQVS